MTSFYILYTHPRTKVRYRSKVEITYRTDKIIKFRISAGDKSIEMDKHIYRKRNQWQTGIINFNPSMRSKEREIMIKDIRKAIDEWLNKNSVH